MRGAASPADWRPSASLELLRVRASLLAQIRGFFAARGVLEVDTPQLSASAASDPHIDHFTLPDQYCARYLQSSPEAAMKRLLAAYRVPIYQLSHVFRAAERGARHNPEFTMLEWYRPGISLGELMDEVRDLVLAVLGLRRETRRSYRDVFQAATGLDPHRASAAELAALARQRLELQFDSECRSDWLDLLFSHLVEPSLGWDCLDFVDDFPQEQAALARVERDASGAAVARRFELFVGGMELANGYLELTEADEQARRISEDLAARRRQGKPLLPVDTRLLDALRYGLPESVGVALGVDRLLMLASGARQIDEVIPFDADRA